MIKNYHTTTRTEPIKEESANIPRKEDDANIILGLKNEMQLLLAQSSPDKEALIDWINKYSEDFSELVKEEPELFERFADAREGNNEKAAFLEELREKLRGFKQKRLH